MTRNERPSIHLSIVAVRRPELLSETLASYREHVFPQIEIASVRANIDPIFGPPEAGDQTEAVLRDGFPEAQINRPAEPGLGKAISHLWSNAPDGHVLHIEDDWAVAHTPDMARAAGWLTQERRTAAVSFLAENHGRKGRRDFSEITEERRVFGMIPRKIRIPRFNTTPGLFEGAFMRGYAARLDIEKCPEKQSRGSWNPNLKAYTDAYRCRFLKTADGGPLLRELGRDWRSEREIRKTDVDGYAVYTYHLEDDAR